MPLFVDADHARLMESKDGKSDDRAFAAETKRKSKAKKHIPLAKAPATGPACLRCTHWMPPVGDEEFGSCRHLVVIDADVLWANVKARSVVERDTARIDYRVGYELLRTGEAFSCSAYKFAADEEAA